MTHLRPAARAVSDAVAKPADRRRSYLALFSSSPLERITMIKHGLHATEARRIMKDLAMGQGETLKALKLSPATFNKKAKQGGALSPDESERVIGMAKLVGQLEAMVQESGDPEGFDATAWMSAWLRAPLPAFGGARPLDFMDTMEGQALVSRALARMQTGAYA